MGRKALVAWMGSVAAVGAFGLQLPDMPTPEQARAAAMADLHGMQELAIRRTNSSYGCEQPFRCAFDLPDPPPQKPSPPAAISVTSLRHKVPRAAKKAYQRSLGLEQKGDYAGAAVELEKAVAKDPEFAEAHVDLGAAYSWLGRLQEAEKATRRAITLAPTFSTAHSNLAWVVAAQGDFAGAETHARRAIDLNAGNARAHLLLGQLLWSGKETHAEGVRHVEFAARVLPEAVRTLRILRGE